MKPVDLNSYNNKWYHPGSSKALQVAWFLLGSPLVRCSVLPGSSFRCLLLRLFGASIGRNVVIKPGVRIKYPWRLKMGDSCWIGEDCWIDNVGDVSLGTDVCLSQGVYVCTGLHDANDRAFGLIVKSVFFDSYSWIGARAIIYPGVSVMEGAIVAAGSVIGRDVPPWEIHAGNPARLVMRREMR